MVEYRRVQGNGLVFDLLSVQGRQRQIHGFVCDYAQVRRVASGMNTRIPLVSAANAWMLRCAGGGFLAVLIAPARNCVGRWQNQCQQCPHSQNTRVLAAQTASRDTT